VKNCGFVYGGGTSFAAAKNCKFPAIFFIFSKIHVPPYFSLLQHANLRQKICKKIFFSKK
jgi:hypothetical protein